MVTFVRGSRPELIVRSIPMLFVSFIQQTIMQIFTTDHTYCYNVTCNDVTWRCDSNVNPRTAGGLISAHVGFSPIVKKNASAVTIPNFLNEK